MDAAARREIDRLKRDMLARIGDDIARDAQRFAPVDTGNLRNSIRAVSDGDAVRVVADTDYAGYVEDGTSNSPAQPYLKPALYRQRGV